MRKCRDTAARTGTTSRPARIVFCTYPSIYSTIVLNILLQELGACVVGIVSSTRVHGTGFLRGGTRLVRTSGVRYALYQFAITSAVRLFRGTTHNLAAAARINNIPIHATRDLNSATGLSFLSSCEADLLVCANFNQRLVPETLSIPVYAGINIHPSLLPRHRGPEPVVHAFLAGETTLGVSVHRMEAEFDTGALIAQASIPFSPTATVFRTYVDLFTEGAKLTACHIAKLDQPSRESAQNDLYVSYETWPDANAVASLIRGGHP